MNVKRIACLKLRIFTNEGKTRCAIEPSSLTQMALVFGTGLGIRQCRIRSVNQVQRYDEIHPFVESQRKSRLARTRLLARQSIRHVEASNIDAHHAVSDRNVVAVSNVLAISNRARFLVELLRLFVGSVRCV